MFKRPPSTQDDRRKTHHRFNFYLQKLMPLKGCDIRNARPKR